MKVRDSLRPPEPGPPSWTPPPWEPAPDGRPGAPAAVTVGTPAGFRPDRGRVFAARPPGVRPPRRLVRPLVRLGVAVVLVLAAAIAIRTFVAAPYYIPSASMEPTLHGCPTCHDDRVLVDKLSYRMHGVRRGDVVVFARPPAWQVRDGHLIKRVIGVAGDTISLRDGAVYVDGRRLAEPYVDPACGPVRTLGDGTGRPVRVVGPVPAGEVFVMGDNRCDSADSRVFGPVPVADIVGRAVAVVWPLGRLHWL